MKFFVISIKKNIFSILFIIFLLSLLLFSESNFIAAQNGLALWASKVLPSLFPFFVATELLCKTDIAYIIGKRFNDIIKKTFNVPGESFLAIFLGIISGYPIGAKIVCNLKNEKVISKIEAERLIAFTNNSGPLFIIGTVGIAMLNDKKIGIILLLSHILSALLVGYFFRFWKKENYDLDYKRLNFNTSLVPIKISNIGEILGNSIKNAIYSMLTIGGFIVLFSVLLSILNSYRIISTISIFLNNLGIPIELSSACITSFIELTNGLNLLSINYNNFPLITLLLISFYLSFGGFCILLQVYSIISKENISIKPYIYGKVLQGFFSIILTFILI